MRIALILSFILVISSGLASQSEEIMTFTEYLAMVKKHHPIVKQANLVLLESEIKVLEARGSFDPKLEFNLDEKQFKDQEYFSRADASFKLPTWYGVSFKADFENNSGVFLNPESTVPSSGLFSMGINLSLGEGLWINQRLATLKQAKLYVNQAEADTKILVNQILYEASAAYFSWFKAYNEKRVYEDFLNNAEERFIGIKSSIELGERPAIDSVEARIIFNNRKLNAENAGLKFLKSSLKISNYLWLENVPVELKQFVIPELDPFISVDNSLNLNELKAGLYEFKNHPKIQSYNYKLLGTEIEKKFRRNQLLPTVDLRYNSLSETIGTGDYLGINDYKFGVFIQAPLFLRKERAKLKLTTLKIDALNFELNAVELTLRNKVESAINEISSYETQLEITEQIVSDYEILLTGEEAKFEAGESSLFLINSRESKLIENRLKAIKTQNELLLAKGTLYNVLVFY